MKKQFVLILIMASWSMTVMAQFTSREQISTTWVKKLYNYMNDMDRDLAKSDMIHKDDKKIIVPTVGNMMAAIELGGYADGGLDIVAYGITHLELDERSFLLICDHPYDGQPLLAIPVLRGLENPKLVASHRIRATEKKPFKVDEDQWEFLNRIARILIEEAQEVKDGYWKPFRGDSKSDYRAFTSTYDWSQEGVVFMSHRHLDNDRKRDYSLDLSALEMDGLTKEQIMLLAITAVETQLFNKGSFRYLGPDPHSENSAVSVSRTYASEFTPQHIVRLQFNDEVQMITIEDVGTPVEVFLPPGAPKDASGNEYAAITLGKYVVTAPDLRATNLNNGDALPIAKDVYEFYGYCTLRMAAVAYPNFDSNLKEYGYLYNAFVLADPRGIAPPGFHVPTWREWSDFKWSLDHPKTSTLLKSKELWPEESYALDEFGFSAVPAGYIDDTNYKEFGKSHRMWLYDPQHYDSNETDGNWKFIFRVESILSSGTSGINTDSYYGTYDLGLNIRFIKILEEQ